MYCPAGQDVTAVARLVLAVTVQALVTNWVVLGVEQGVQELAEALLKSVPAEHDSLPPAVPTAPPPTQA